MTTRKLITGNTENTETKARCGNIEVIALQMKCGLNIRNEQCVNVRGETYRARRVQCLVITSVRNGSK